MRIKNKKKQKRQILRNMVFLSFVIIGFLFLQYQYMQDVTYEGKGQQFVKGKDGYTTTFTTIDNKIYQEYKQGNGASWANMPYWDNQMWDNGC